MTDYLRTQIQAPVLKWIAGGVADCSLKGIKISRWGGSCFFNYFEYLHNKAGRSACLVSHIYTPHICRISLQYLFRHHDWSIFLILNTNPVIYDVIIWCCLCFVLFFRSACYWLKQWFKDQSVSDVYVNLTCTLLSLQFTLIEFPSSV